VRVAVQGDAGSEADAICFANAVEGVKVQSTPHMTNEANRHGIYIR
jgi:hypothetical protein